MKQITNLTIGSDIEWFLRDKKTGEIISAEGIAKGTKAKPFKFDKKNPFYATSLDNVLYEGNIPPATNSYQFYRNVNKLIKHISSTLPEELEIAAIPSARLDDRFLQTENAKVFGCDVSYNCWTGEPIHPQPIDLSLRSAGFHVHCGYDNPGYEENIAIGKAMDLFLGIPSILIEPENERKKVGYGCAGNIRHQLHGLEYRSLSSYFASERKLIEWSFKNTKAAVKFINDGRLGEIEPLGQLIQNTINFEDKATAQELVKQFKIFY